MGTAVVATEERRARIWRWVGFTSLDHVTTRGSQGGGQCMICERRIDFGEVDFTIIFNGAVSLRLDQACMELWREAVGPPE